MNIFLIGPMATGKSYIGKALANQLKHRFYDTDDLICQNADMDIATIFEKEGETGFRKREADALRGLGDDDDIVVATGGGAVLDKQNCRYMKENGTVVYLNTALDTRYARIQNPTERPLLMEGDVYEVMQNLDSERMPIYEALADFIVDNNGNVAATIAKIIEHIDETKQT